MKNKQEMHIILFIICQASIGFRKSVNNTGYLLANEIYVYMYHVF